MLQARDRRIRVCFYISFPGGGIGLYTRHLMEHLALRRNLEIELVCLPEFYWKDCEDVKVWDGLWRISSPVPPIRKARFLVGQVLNPLRAIQYARRRNIDVLHLADFNHLTFPFWNRALSKSGIPFVISAHDIRRQKAILSRSWETEQLKAAYRAASGILVHSHVQAEELEEFAGPIGGKIEIVPHGPYDYGTTAQEPGALRRELGVPKFARLALFFGQIRDEKNLEGLIEAMATTSPHSHLLVAGQGGSKHRDVDYYRNLAAANGISDRVYFLPRYIEGEEIPGLFASCDWVALPYSEVFTSQSGVLAIAARYRKPILASSAPVIAETVSGADIGVVCKGDNPAALANGIFKLEELLSRNYVFPFDDYLERYSWEENARITTDLYAQVCSKDVRNGF